MKLDKEFEDKLKRCIDKYGKKHNNTNGTNDVTKVEKIDIPKRHFWKRFAKKNKGVKDVDSVSLVSDHCHDVDADTDADTDAEEAMPDYYFNYKLTDMDTYMLDGDYEGDAEFYKKRKNIGILIHFYDDEMVKACQDVIDQPEIYSSKPKLEIRMLLSCIHNFRMKFDPTLQNAHLIKRVLDFIEELFDDEITMMDKMIENNMIDFKSLWYYFDKADTIYSTKHTEKRICFKHVDFSYSEIGLGQRVFILNGNIIAYQNDNFYSSEYSHVIKKYDGLRNIKSFDIAPVTDEERITMIEYGNKMIQYAPKISHMKLKGKKHVLVRNSVMTVFKNERIMIDEEGINKYGSKPYIFDNISIIELENITEEHKLLMFPYVSVYNLGVRKMWGMSHISDIEPVVYNEQAFEQLVIDPYKKMIIETLVQNHDSSDEIDIITDKGRGLIFLLHGPPGVGKTLTSEAISEYMKRPLFSVNVSDLGTNPDVVEDEMEMIIDYAKRWNAIIMIDEADIFVEAREMSNIIRNAMVGTFLKFLEYNQNIMFLTTNRITEIDLAVKSRMNLLLSYHDLEFQDRSQIWTHLLKKNNITISEKTIEELSEKKMNGREIRNNIKILTSMFKNKEYNDDDIIELVNKCHSLSHEFETSVVTMYN